MHFYKSMALRALLAVTMLCGAAQALAAPVYHVTINTASLAGQAGYLDFLLLSLGGAAPVDAVISNISGNFTTSSYLSGDASGTAATGLAIGNGAAWNEAALWANFGGVYKFDVSFTGSGSGAGANLGVTLLDSSFNYLGSGGDVVTFALLPDSAPLVTSNASLASVSTVPEPETAWLLAAGLALLALRRRRA